MGFPYSIPDESIPFGVGVIGMKPSANWDHPALEEEGRLTELTDLPESGHRLRLFLVPPDAQVGDWVAGWHEPGTVVIRARQAAGPAISGEWLVDWPETGVLCPEAEVQLNHLLAAEGTAREVRLREVITRMLIHEVNNGLFGVTLSTGMMGAGEPVEQDSIDQIESSCKELQELASDCGTYFRMKSGVQSPSFEEVDIRPLFEEGWKSAEAAAQARGISLSLDGTPETWVTRADPALLRRALILWFRYLVGIAPRGAQVAVCFLKRGDASTLEVSLPELPEESFIRALNASPVTPWIPSGETPEVPVPLMFCYLLSHCMGAQLSLIDASTPASRWCLSLSSAE